MTNVDRNLTYKCALSNSHAASDCRISYSKKKNDIDFIRN